MVITLQNFWQKHRKAILVGGILVLGALILPHLVHAAPPPSPTPPPPQSSTDVANSMLAGLSQIMKLLQVIFWPILMMIGSLMQNDILFGAGMEARLLEIWVNVRNIVNILMVLVLLGIALYNVMGAGENYHFKTILPKFVIALIAVNFTFIGIKIALDAVNVVSTAIFALPSSVEETLKVQGSDTTGKVGILTVDQSNAMCSALYGGTVGSSEYLSNVKAANDKAPSICADSETNGSYLRSPEAVNFFSRMNAQNAALIMAVTLGKADLLDKVYVNVESPTVGKLLLNTLFSLVLYVVYGTAYIALFVTLLIRLVALWVMIAVSPLMVLPFVLPEKLKGMVSGGDMQEKFMKTILVPIPVALVMSIGFVMLQGLQAAKLNTGNTLLNNPTISMDLLTSGLTSLQELIVAFGAVAFIWMGVFMALKGTYAEGITESIKGTVEGAGKALGKFAVGSIPLFPTTKGTATIGAVGVALQQLPNLPRQKFQEEASIMFPGLTGKSLEHEKKLGDAKTLADAKKVLPDIARSQFRSAGFQQNFGNSIEKWNAQDKAQLQKSLTGTKYKNAAEFQAALKKGDVSEADMALVYSNMGISPSSGELPKAKTAEEEAKAGILSPEAKGLRNAAERKKMRESGLLPPEVKDEDLNKLDADIKAGENAPPGSDKAKKADEAKKKLEDIAKGVKEKTQKASQLDTNVTMAIQDNTRDVSGTKPASKANADAIEGKLKEKVDELVAGGMKQEEAEKKVLGVAATALNQDRMDGLEKVAGPLLSKAIAQKKATPTPVAPKTPTPGGGGAKPGGATGTPLPTPKGGATGAGTPTPTPKPPPPTPTPQKPPPLAIGQQKIVKVDDKTYWQWNEVGGKGTGI